MEDIQKIEKAIKWSYIMMFVCAGILLLTGIALRSTNVDSSTMLLIDGTFTLALALIVLFKNSRAASTIYFISFLLGKVLMMVIGQFALITFIISVVLAIVFYRGMVATYHLHNIVKETGTPI